MHEKKLSIIIHKGNANKNHREHLTPTKMGIIKKREIQVLVRMWKNWNPHSLLLEK